ncbi:hypothetical protein DW674_06130 [Mitsuokella multacida]|uniref:Uncharacterized protein n=2 Tax=Mitsuokella multacida TaxID=52226 RepID=A0A414NX52_9FIRM|nr:hypothetical protein DW674_06130 [Mitsuokella multacida]
MVSIIMKIPLREKRQGVVEYALLLAFVVIIGAALYTSGLANSVKTVFDMASMGISNPEKAQDMAYANRMAEMLKKAIRFKKIELSDGSYVIIYAQSKPNPNYNGQNVNGSGTVGYGGFQNMWNTLSGYDETAAKEASVHQSGIDWYGVKVEKNKGSDTYKITYVEGSGYSNDSHTRFDDSHPSDSRVLEESWTP